MSSGMRNPAFEANCLPRPEFDSERTTSALATTLPTTPATDSGAALRVTAGCSGVHPRLSARFRENEAGFSEAELAQMEREWGSRDPFPVMEAIDEGDLGFLARHLRTGSPGRAVCAAIADWLDPPIPLSNDQHWKLCLKRLHRGRPRGSVARPPATIAIEMHRALSKRPGLLKKQAVACVAEACHVSAKTVRNGLKRVRFKAAERVD